ncbi:hypothetical protein QC762_0019390 [Podospora pseudocomata]|uniref:Uncharacterized protein n=1 Tax=Podospora pseudocomata TaxID=2093779 RepID=A0ABR0GXZ5_9PEZI|nr:hypothetical protein QC762_0019390 [Podospora pseudocomata]
MSGFGCFWRDVIVLTAHHQNSKRLLSPHAGAFFSGFLNNFAHLALITSLYRGRHDNWFIYRFASLF